MRLEGLLGELMPTALTSPPFCDWQAVRTVEEALPADLLRYVFSGRGVEFVCDLDERIRAIMVRDDAAPELVGLGIGANRDEVRAQMGAPLRSRERRFDPIFGEMGAWDRFEDSRMALHVEYWPTDSTVKMMTLMRPDAVPGR